MSWGSDFWDIITGGGRQKRENERQADIARQQNYDPNYYNPDDKSRQSQAFKDLRGLYAYAKGRYFNRWIDYNKGNSRSNGKSQGDLIETPGYIIESILRDEVLTERDLVTDAYTGTGSPTVYKYEISGVKSGVDDYYNYSYIHNSSAGVESLADVTDYDGTNKLFTLSGDVGATAGGGDKVNISNVRGDYIIDIASFDVIGNTNNGVRKDWKFGRSIYEKESAGSLIKSLLFESFLLLHKSYDQYKLIALDENTGSVDTWSTPLIIGGQPLVSANLTPLESVFTDYKLNYYYEYGGRKYVYDYQVNDKFRSTDLDSSLQTICSDAVTNYKVKQRFEHSSRWIYDKATAELLITKFVNWFGKQRLLVRWGGGCKDYIKYEIGDQVILNYASLIPTGVNNTAKFMIFNKRYVFQRGDPHIIFTLIQMG